MTSKLHFKKNDSSDFMFDNWLSSCYNFISICMFIYCIFLAQSSVVMGQSISGIDSEMGEMGSETINAAYYSQAMYVAKRQMHISNLAELVRSSRQNDETLLSAIHKFLTEIPKQMLIAKDVLIRHGIKMGYPVPMEDEPGKAYALMLENTALLAELILRFPDLAHSIFDNTVLQDHLSAPSNDQVGVDTPKENTTLQNLLAWCVNFSEASQLLPDHDKRLLQLALQEMHVKPRGPNYVNPFTEMEQRARRMQATKANKVQLEEERRLARRQRRRQQFKGPRMSTTQLRTEL